MVSFGLISGEDDDRLPRHAREAGLVAFLSKSLEMDALLDATEDAIREKVRELLDGNIEARPLDKDACAYCPVMNCERRLG